MKRANKTKQEPLNQEYGFEELQVLRPIIKSMGVDKQYDGNTLLHIKVAKNDLLGVKYLIENFANLNIQNNQGQTCLHVAVNNGYIDLVKFLLTNGANLSLKDKDGDVPLDGAYNYGEENNDWRIFQVVDSFTYEFNNKNLPGEATENNTSILYTHPNDEDLSTDVVGEQAKQSIAWEDLT